MTKTALITGITGQDGSYLAELLLEKGYEVYGLVRRLSTPNITRLDHILDKINLVEGDLTDESSINNAMKLVQPHEVYNLAAQSFVGTSWNQPVLTSEVTGLGAVHVLESVKNHSESAKVYQAASSEMYWKVSESPQNENTKFYPRSPYGCAKVYAYWICVNYRESYDMFISNGILFNHESPRRGLEFVTRKITNGVAQIYHKRVDELRLGNLESKRDWGYAKDYVEAAWLMLQQKKPDDYVIATGESHSVKEFVERAFLEVGLDWKDYVKVDPKFIRPTEVDLLIGDASKARRELGWEPRVKFEELVRIMVEADLESVGKSI
jgi:GDPmannose 4,6-dehydratase